MVGLDMLGVAVRQALGMNRARNEMVGEFVWVIGSSDGSGEGFIW